MRLPAALLCGLISAGCFANAPSLDSGLTVDDVIGLASPVQWRPAGVALFSPDSRRIAMVVQRGDLAHNRLTYTFLVASVRDALEGRRGAETVLKLSARPTAPSVRGLTWLADNRTLMFLASGRREGAAGRGEPSSRDDGTPQVLALDLRTRRLRRLTNAADGVVSFSVTPNGATLIYAAAAEADGGSMTARAARGFTVRPGEGLTSLVPALVDVPDPERHVVERGERYFIQRFNPAGEPTSFKTVAPPHDDGPCVSFFLPPLSLAPTGRYAVVRCSVDHPPERWAAYADPHIKEALRQGTPPQANTWVTRLMLIDVDRATMSPLMDAPLAHHPSVVWEPSGQSLLLGNAYRPLDPDALAHPHAGPWESDVVLAQVDVPSGRVAPIGPPGDYTVVGFDPAKETVEVGTGEEAGTRRRFRKVGGEWTLVPEEVQGEHTSAGARPRQDATTSGGYEVALDQDMNRPPRVVLRDVETDRTVTLVDLNPHLAHRTLAREEVFDWEDRLGGHWTAGLYWPLHYEAGKRYPLVIQTHFFRPEEWSAIGMQTVGAAQVLAAHDIFVLQIGDGGTSHWGAIQGEAEGAMAGFEGAIDALDARGWVDRNRIGLAAWSRTCWYVKHTLTHSSYPFAAAIVADGVDFGYTQYVIARTSEADQRYGGPPWGESAAAWNDSPEFHLDRVRTPFRIEAITPEALLWEWAWYSGLTRLAAPVELAYFPAGDHILRAPWERETSLQGSVDWFAFWLQDAADSDPGKADQYERWRALRTLRDSAKARPLDGTRPMEGH